jgi:hypothetical protein
MSNSQYSPALDSLLKMLEPKSRLKIIDPAADLLKISVTEIEQPKADVVEPKVDVVEPKVEPKVDVVEPKVDVAVPKTITYFSSAKKIAKKRLLFASTHYRNVGEDARIAWNLLALLSANFQITYFSDDDSGENIRAALPAILHVVDFKRALDSKPDIIFFFYDAGKTSLYLNQVASGAKVVCYLNHVYPSLPSSAVFDRVDLFLTSSEKKRALLVGQGKPVHVLKPGFDLPKVDKVAARKSLHLPTEGFYVVSYTNKSAINRDDLLAMGFADFVTKNPEVDVRLVCISDTDDVKKIFEAETQGVHSQKLVCFRETTDEQTHMLLNAADIGVRCVDGEGIVLNEIAGFGKPSVATEACCLETGKINIASKAPRYVKSASGDFYKVNSFDHYDISNGIMLYYTQPGMVESHGADSAGSTIRWAEFGKRLLQLL